MRLVVFVFLALFVALLPLGGCGRTECPSGVCLPDASAGGSSVTAGGFIPAGGAAGGSSGGGVSGGGVSGGGVSGGGVSGGGVSGGGVSGGGSAGGGSAGGGSPSDGGCAPGSLLFFPTTLDFGDQAAGCSRSLPLVLLNTCAFAQSASLSAIGSVPMFRADAGMLVVPAGGAIEVPVTFQPPVLGPRTGTLVGSSSSGLLSIPLRGLGVAPGDVTDTFVLAASPKADMLFIVSDGAGMRPAQQALGTNSGGFLRYLTLSATDFRLGVLVGRSDGGSLVQGSAGAPLLLSSTTPALATRYEEKFALGESGAPTTSCLRRAIEHFSADAGWLRAGASLGLICVQNTHELLQGDTSAWLTLLRAATGKTRNELSVSALANFTRACPGPEDGTLLEATFATFGSRHSICTVDAGVAVNLVEELGRSAGGYRPSFFLSRPGPVDGGFEVQVDAMTVPMSDPSDAGVWSYDAARNALVFEPLSVPEPGKTLTVRYRPACGP
jgi:hypothetical protein